jgi:hypothetical protein
MASEVCGDCEKAGTELEALLTKGLTFVYSDGSTETITVGKKG